MMRESWAYVAPIATPSCDWRECGKHRTLQYPRRRAKNDHVAKLLGTRGKLQRMRHSFAVGVTEPREPEEGLDHVNETLARYDLDLYPERHGCLRSTSRVIRRA